MLRLAIWVFYFKIQCNACFYTYQGFHQRRNKLGLGSVRDITKSVPWTNKQTNKQTSLLFYNVTKYLSKKREYFSKKCFAPLWIRHISSFDGLLGSFVVPSMHSWSLILLTDFLLQFDRRNEGPPAANNTYSTIITKLLNSKAPFFWYTHAGRSCLKVKYSMNFTQVVAYMLELVSSK